MMVAVVARRCSNDAHEGLNEPWRSMSMTLVKPLGETVPRGTRKLPAARQAGTSMGPSSAALLAKAFPRAPNWRTSAATAQTLAPSAESSAAAAFSFSLVRPQIATLAPKAAKFFATPRLIPLPPPVTKTVLPLNRSFARYRVTSMLFSQFSAFLQSLVDCPADFFGVPALHHIGDQAGYLVPEAHDHLMYGVQPPLIELLPHASLLEQCLAQYGQRASDVLFDQGRLALQVSLNPPPDVVPQQSVELFGLQMLDQFPQKRLPLLTILLAVHQVVNQVPHCLIELLAHLLPRVLHHFADQRHDSLSKFVDHVTVQSTGRIAGRFAELGLDQTLLRDEPALQGLQRPIEQHLVPFAFCQHRQHVACYPRHVKAQQLRREGAIEELPDLLVLQPAQHHRNKIRDGRGYRKAVPARSQPPGKRLRRVVLPKLGGDVFLRQEVLFDEIAEALADPVLVAGDDRAMGDRQTQRVAKQGFPGVPVGQGADRARPCEARYPVQP